MSGQRRSPALPWDVIETILKLNWVYPVDFVPNKAVDLSPRSFYSRVIYMEAVERDLRSWMTVSAVFSTFTCRRGFGLTKSFCFSRQVSKDAHVSRRSDQALASLSLTSLVPFRTRRVSYHGSTTPRSSSVRRTNSSSSGSSSNSALLLKSHPSSASFKSIGSIGDTP